MKKITKILCFILVIITVLSVTGCAKKEATTIQPDSQSQNQTQNDSTNKEDNKKETYDEVILKLDSKSNFSLTMLDNYKKQLAFNYSDDGKTIYALDRNTNIVVFKILIDSKENDNAIATKKVGSYTISAVKGDEINEDYETGKLLKEIQDNIKTIIETAKSTDKDVSENTKTEETDKENTDDKVLTYDEAIEESRKEVEKEKGFWVEEKEDGTKIHHYKDEEGNDKTIVENPNKEKPEPPKHTK